MCIFNKKNYLIILKKNDIVPVAYCPIGRPNRPENKQAKGDTVDLEDPVIVNIAKRLEINPAEVCILWIIKHGGVAIPFSAKREQYEKTIAAVKRINDSLTDDDMQTDSSNR